ncbi:MAG: hypothetical protein NXI04_16900 [Planctomycetaceae bacterium]|nr:hypothetical protein [Planctomycetaceae bacterium]
MLNLATKFRPEPVAFQRAFESGFRCAEFFLNREVLENVTQVACWAEAFDMRYALHFPNKPDLDDHHLENCVQLYHSLQASAMVMHPPMIRRFKERLHDIDPTLVLAIETMRVPPDEIVDWVGQQRHVTLDMEHIWCFTLPGKPLDAFFHLLDRIFTAHGNCVKHVHMPGFLPGQGEHRPMYTSREFCLGVFDVLADHQYRGLVVSEVDMAFQNPFDLQMDVLLYQGWADARKSGRRASVRESLPSTPPCSPTTTAHATDER